MTKLICEIRASSWFYYKVVCYDAWSHERKIGPIALSPLHVFIVWTRTTLHMP